jgi:hypothetical protein
MMPCSVLPSFRRIEGQEAAVVSRQQGGRSVGLKVLKSEVELQEEKRRYDIDVLTTMSYIRNMQVFRLQLYLRAMRAMGFDESGMAEIERSICAAPDRHPTIRGLRGVRKARFARPGTGKSGGGRAIYYVVIGLGRLYMMTAYAKSKQGDLTARRSCG